MQKYRIHGDNIVECERIANLIIKEVNPHKISRSLIAPSTISVDMSFSFQGSEYEWNFELLPGFNKSNRHRWSKNIFDILKDNGSFLDETPDAIITSIENNCETILCAIEFCSALQAGNQAWQRSGRAFSTGRTGCHYLYIVDFVKYELDPSTRERKNLRFPNAAVPYSYVSFSESTNNFVAQIYVRSEEFDKSRDSALATFNENDFAEDDLAQYLVKRLAGIDTTKEQKSILQKNLNVVRFLARSTGSANSFTEAQWNRLSAYKAGIVSYSIDNAKFNFHKTIAAKSQHGKSASVLSLIDKLSVGMASRDLPMGIIPASKRPAFASGLEKIYPNSDKSIIKKIANSNQDLILCLIKGFKPRGDDNRPDRGVLPLTTMLSSTDSEILTFIYGPLLYKNYELLKSNPKSLAKSNGLWKSILGLTNYVLLDVPILNNKTLKDAELLIDSTPLKNDFTQSKTNSTLSQSDFPAIPNGYHEDDVDTCIHYTFSHLLGNSCFEGLCNPPGGDWSGISILHNNIEKRWLSLPRVSDDIDGKRPDHILELFGVFDKPLILSIESKERSIDLESNVGNGLINYIKHLMNYIPNVEKDASDKWHQSTKYVNFNDFEIISAAAYLKSEAQDNSTVFNNSNCDMLFLMTPNKKGWLIEIVPRTNPSKILKQYIQKQISSIPESDIVIK